MTLGLSMFVRSKNRVMCQSSEEIVMTLILEEIPIKLGTNLGLRCHRSYHPHVNHFVILMHTALSTGLYSGSFLEQPSLGLLKQR